MKPLKANLWSEFVTIRPGKIAVLSLVCLVFCTALSAHALLYDFNTVISGATPGGETPWLTAEFTNETRTIGGNDIEGVLLKLRAPNLMTSPSSEFVTKWFFNSTLEDSINDLKFSTLLEDTALAKKNNFAADANEQNAGAGALFDIYFKFQTCNTDPNRFQNGDLADIFMYGVDGLTADSFNTLSFSNDDNKQYFAEAHIQGISEDEGSAWVVPGPETPVPEPGTLVLLGTGLFGLAVFGKRRLNKY